jgi:hypothetical protein
MSRRSGAFPPIPNVFPKIVGRTPRSARVPLDPLLASRVAFTQTAKADERVVPRGDPRTGGPPHNQCSPGSVA